MRSLPGAPGLCPYGVQVDDVGQITGMFPWGAGSTRGAPTEDGPCPVNS